jgi:hypothetical protein
VALLGAISIGALFLGPLAILAMVVAAVGLALYLVATWPPLDHPSPRAWASHGAKGPESGRWKPLARPLQHDELRLGWWGWMFASLPAAVGLHYALRGRYYWHSKMFLLVVLVAVASAAFYGLVRRPLRRPGAWRWVGTALGASAAALSLAAFLAPSASAAQRYLAAGDLGRARAELAQLDEEERRGEGDAVRAELEAHEALALQSCEAVVQRQGALPDRLRAKVRSHADRMALARAQAAVAAGKWEEGRLALRCGSEFLRSSVMAKALERQISLHK